MVRCIPFPELVVKYKNRGCYAGWACTIVSVAANYYIFLWVYRINTAYAGKCFNKSLKTKPWNHLCLLDSSGSVVLDSTVVFFYAFTDNTQ